MVYNDFMITDLTSPKLSQPQRMQVLALLARGDTSNQVNEYLEKKFNISLAPSSIHDIRTRHKDTIEAMRLTIQDSQVAEATALVKKSRRILNKKLDRAERDMSEIEKLDEDYREERITSSEYKRRKETLLNVSISEIASVTKNMHEQTKLSQGETPPPLPENNPVQTEALLKAIKAGDTVELQRIILNPQGEMSGPV